MLSKSQLIHYLPQCLQYLSSYLQDIDQTLWVVCKCQSEIFPGNIYLATFDPVAFVLLTRYKPKFYIRFLGPSLTGNKCPGGICPS